MAWQDELTPAERRELEQAEARRDKARAEFNDIRIKLKRRAESRERVRRQRENA